ncbi:MAG: ATP-grasp domain-containing protein [Longimicrobiales bacterium]
MPRILVTDAEQRACLAVVRSLGAAGHHVVVCGSRARPLAGASRYCRATHVVPSPKADAAGYAAAVLKVVDAERIDVVIPVTDLSASLVPRLRVDRPGVVVAFPESDAYERISDKRHLMEVARGLGVPVPKQLVLEERGSSLTADALRRAGIDFPLVLKPARSAVAGLEAVHSFGVQMVESESDLRSALSTLHAEAYPLLVQERIQGPGLGAFLLAHHGRVIASFAHRRIREKPPTGGVSVYRESVPLREDLRRYSELILAHFKWSGVAMVEFKEDSATGTPYLMEVNGRFWGSLQLAIDAGVDFPTLLLRTALGEEVAPVTSYRSGVRSRWLWGDVDHLIGMMRMPRSVLATHPELPGRMGALARFVLPWRPGDRFEVLRFRDPAPFFRESVQWIEAVLGR